MLKVEAKDVYLYLAEAMDFGENAESIKAAALLDAMTLGGVTSQEVIDLLAKGREKSERNNGNREYADIAYAPIS